MVNHVFMLMNSDASYALFLCQQAKVVLYEGAVAKKELVFDASGSDKLNWFTFEKLTISSWTDVNTEPKNFFSIQGNCNGANCRSFYISRSHNGCDADDGWLVYADSTWCSWETDASRNKNVLYSKLSTYTNWNTNSRAR